MDHFESLVLEILLQEAPVSWKTIQKAFINNKEIGGPEGLDNISKLAGFNNFQEFFEDVYKTLYRDEGGQKYEPSVMELTKIFKFLLKVPEEYKRWIQKQLNIYGDYRYKNDTEIFDSLVKIKNLDEFKDFLYSLSNLDSDVPDGVEKVYSDSDIDIYEIKTHKEVESFCKGTTWCIKEQGWYDRYTKEKNTKFYIIVSRKEWYNQTEGVRKKYALRIHKSIDNVKSSGDDLFVNFIREVLKKNDHFFYAILESTIPLNIKDEIYNILSIKWSEDVYEAVLDTSAHIQVNYDNKEKIKNYFTVFEKYINFIRSNKLEEYLKQVIKLNGAIINYLKQELTSKVFIDNILDKFKTTVQENEFTNNNQNVRIRDFDQLPEPYHSMLKNFPPYQRMIQIRNKVSDNYENLFDSFFSSEDYLKTVIAETLEDRILEKNENSFLEKVYDKLVKYFSIIEDIEKNKGYVKASKNYMISPVDRNDIDALLVTSSFFDEETKDNDYYLIKGIETDELYCFTTLNDNHYKTFMTFMNNLILKHAEPNLMNAIIKIASRYVDQINGDEFVSFIKAIKNKVRKLDIDRDILYTSAEFDNLGQRERTSFFVSLYNFLRNKLSYYKSHISFLEDELKKFNKIDYEDAILLAKNIALNAMALKLIDILDLTLNFGIISELYNETQISNSINGNPNRDYSYLGFVYSEFNQINDRIYGKRVPPMTENFTSGWSSLSKKNFNTNNTVLAELDSLKFFTKHKNILNIIKKMASIYIFTEARVFLFYDDDKDFISYDYSMISNDLTKPFLSYNGKYGDVIIGLNNTLPVNDVIEEMANKIIEISKK